MPRSRWTPLGLALLCAHCSLGALAAGAAALFGALGWVTGQRILAWTAPPILLLGAFVWLVRAPKQSCALHPASESPTPAEPTTATTAGE